MIKTLNETVSSFRIAVIKDVAERLNEAGVRYAVLHGIESYPDGIGRDVDMCIDAPDRSKALDLIISCLNDNGLTVTMNLTPWAEWIVGYKHTYSGSLGVEIDLLSSMQWGWGTLFDGVHHPYKKASKGPFFMDQWAGFVKRVLIHLLAGNTSRFECGKKHAQELAIQEDEKEVVVCALRKLFGVRLGNTFESSIREKNLLWISDNIHALRTHFLFQTARNPMKAFGAILCWIRNEWAESFFPKHAAPVVHLVGQNEENLKRVAEKLSEAFSAHFIFTSVEVQSIQNEGRGLERIKHLYRRRLKCSRLGLFLILNSADNAETQSGRLISPVDLKLNVDDAGEGAIRRLEQNIVECFGQMNTLLEVVE